MTASPKPTSICVLHRALASSPPMRMRARRIRRPCGNFFGDDRGRVEHDAVVHGDAGDVTEGLGHGFQIARAEAQQVGVARGSVRHVVPEREQQRALSRKRSACGLVRR